MLQEAKNLYHLFIAIAANLYYGFPSRRLKVIGVSGTDGKTTTTHLIAHILKRCGKKVSFISSIHASIAGKKYVTGFHVTTPSPFILQKFLKQAANKGEDFFVLETTSHALDQNRVWGIKYEVGVITNVTHEHLDYHQNYEAYLKTKMKLLKMARISIVNKDDQSYKKIKERLKVKDYNSKFKNSERLKNLTKFNQYNYSAAYTVCKELGLSDKEILKGMITFQLPKGRLELVYNKDFKVIIDFAHTPNAFKNLLPEIRKKYLSSAGRLIHVFGAAGKRDFTKRPLMGEVSSQYANYIILTEEDYRTENPKEICQQIASGIKNNCSYEVIINRQQAIKKAISMAKKNDVIVLTGKSHEKSLCRGKTEYFWSEYEAVMKALKIYK